MIEVIAVDDSSIDLFKLEAIFSKLTNAKLIATFDNGLTAIQFAEVHKPQIAFVDIEMPEMDGFEVGEKLSHLGVAIVFLTSHPQHALKAFDYAALHYLVKPAKAESIFKAIERLSGINSLKHPMLNKISSEQIHYAKEGLKVEGAVQAGNKIFINTIGEIIIVKLADIMYLISEGNYTLIKYTANDRIVSSKTLKTYESILANSLDFMRVQRSAIVNRKYVKSIRRDKSNHVLIITDGTEIELGVNKKLECMAWLMELNR